MKLAEYRKMNNPLSHCAVRIGIDAGVNTGIAIYGHEADEWLLFTESFWQAYDRIEKYDRDYTGIVIEVPSGHVIHRRKDGESSGFGRDRMAANVGSNRREAVLLAERFEALGFTVVRKKPTRTKWNAEDLKRHTGITRRTNEHVRDAIRLVHEHI